jgi:hypothetical protein
VKIVGLCSFYDESPTWLAACVAGAARICDHLVFVDGAYFLYDKDGSNSGVESHDAIARACHAAGVGYTLHVPDGCWMGNEVEKRAFMFQLAEQITTEQDWYLILDADMIVTSVERELVRLDLEATDLDAMNIEVLERTDVYALGGHPVGANSNTFSFRGLFRALRGLTVKGAHYVYAHPDADARSGWRALWGPHTHFDVAPAGDTPITVEHWSKWRTGERAEAAWDYYRLRDQLNVESITSNHIETVDGTTAELT